MKNNLYVFFLFFITGLMSCSHHSGLYEHAEKIMSQHPDSVLTLLSTIQDVNDLSEKDRAMYYLLLTEAQNKTYVKPTSDSLITIAVEFFDKTEDWERKAKAWYYKGRVNQDLGDVLHAQDYYLKVLQEEDKIDDNALLGRINNSMGMLYTYQEVYERAIPYQQKALEYFEIMNDSIGQSFVLRDIGRNLTALNKIDSAIIYYEKALYKCNLKNKPSIYRVLANLYIDIEDYPRGFDYIKMALSFPLKSPLLESSYFVLGKFYQKTNQIDSAYYYLRCSAKSSRLQTQAASYYHLAQLELFNRNWERYASNQVKYEALRDSISLVKQTESIRRMENLYDYHKAEAKLLHADILLNRLKVRNLSMYLFVIVCIVAVVVISILGYVQIKRKKLRLQEHRDMLIALEKKHKEDLTRISENEKLIEELERLLQESSVAYNEKEKELMTLQKLKLEVENQSLKYVKTESQLLVDKFRMSDIYYKFHIKEDWRPKDEDWNELFTALDETYDKFTRRLMSVFSRLTTTELRVCCLVKANVPPVTIAMLIVTTPTNVSMIRKRLYEKVYPQEKGSSEKFDRFIREYL